MIKLRRNTFETNSSSVHALVVCRNEVFEDFKKGKLCIIFSGFGADSFFIENNKDKYKKSFNTAQGDTGYFVSWKFACEVYKNWVKNTYTDDIRGYQRACEYLGIKDIDSLTTRRFKKFHRHVLMHCFSYKDWEDGESDYCDDIPYVEPINKEEMQLNSWFFLG